MRKAEQGDLVRLKVFIWIFSATILRPLTYARNYATIARPKRQIRRCFRKKTCKKESPDHRRSLPLWER